jgi:hypothetical protein
MTRNGTRWASLIALLVWPALAAEEPSFSALVKEADQAASHGEGMRYANHTKHFLLARREEAARACIASATETSMRFDMLVWMAKDGTIERARVDPESPVSLCVANGVVGTRVRPPDKVPWAVHVEWDVTRDP